MTLKLQDNVNSYQMSFNIADAGLGRWTLTLKSLASQDNIFSIDATVVETNSRFTRFSFDVPDGLDDSHKNGIYEYTVTNGTTQGTEVGLMKLVTADGGTTGTTPYISNNENRQAVTYYRPNY